MLKTKILFEHLSYSQIIILHLYAIQNIEHYGKKITDWSTEL